MKTKTVRYTPKCDCGCGGAMQLNGLRFVCNRQTTLLDHVDDWPIYDVAPALLAALKWAESLLAGKLEHGNIIRAAIEQAEGGAQ